MYRYKWCWTLKLPKFGSCLGKHEKLHKLVLVDRKLKLREIAKELKISEGSEFTILHEHLSMKMLCSKWVPRLLTVDQKQQRVDDSDRCLQLFQRNKKFLCKYMTMDETLIHHFSSGSNWESAEWTAAGKSRLKSPKMQTSARFWSRCFGMHTVFCSSITLKKEEPSIANII